jgi:TPR repeat protein
MDICWNSSRQECGQSINAGFRANHVNLLRGSLVLVFGCQKPMLASMDQLPWYRRFFGTASVPSLQSTRIKAEQGDAEAQFALGLKFTMAGSERDLEQAAQWYQKAADQNHSLAQYNLSVMFAAGQGVPQNESTAMIWTRKAAEGGDAGAQFQLGSKYHRSSIASQPKHSESVENRVEAYKWLHLAVNQGYHGSEAARERLTLSMSQEEVNDGNRRVAAFEVRTPA